MHNSSRNRLVAVIMALVMMFAAATLVSCKKGGSDKPRLGLNGSGAAGNASVAGSETTSGQASAQKVPAGIPKPLDGSGKSGTGGTGSAKAAKPKPGVIVKPTEGIAVKVIWWNDTVDKAPNGFEIVYGTQSFKPDTTKKTASSSIGPCPYGTLVSLTVYPDGRGGKSFEVPFTVTKSMEANSERDAIHVEVSDTSLRVLGNAVDNFEQNTKR